MSAAAADQEAAARAQIEYYFGYANYSRDEYLRSLADADGYVALDALQDFPKLHKLTQGDGALLKRAAASSTRLEVSEDKVRARRIGASSTGRQAQHLVLGVLQPQEVTDAAVSIAASADHTTSSGSPVPLHVSDLSHNSYDTPPPGPLFARPLPAVESAPRGDSPGSVRSVSVTSSLRRRTPSLVASSVMDTHSVAAAKDITRAPRMPRDDTMLPRPCLKTRSDPGA